MIIISFDLDSTLTDPRHRAWMVNATDRNLTDWDAYSMAAGGDVPGPAMPLAYTFQSLGARIVITSARSECARQLTMDWLHRHSVFPEMVVLYDEELFGDELRKRLISHIELKVRQLKYVNDWYRRYEREHISLHVDDWPEVRVEVGQRLRIPVVIVKPNHELVPRAAAQ